MIRTRSSLGEDGRRERGYERKDRQSLGRQRTAPLSNRPRITVQRPGCECILSRRLSPPRSAPLWHASSAAAAHRSQSPVRYALTAAFPPFSPRARDEHDDKLSPSLAPPQALSFCPCPFGSCFSRRCPQRAYRFDSARCIPCRSPALGVQSSHRMRQTHR